MNIFKKVTAVFKRIFLLTRLKLKQIWTVNIAHFFGDNIYPIIWDILKINIKASYIHIYVHKYYFIKYKMNKGIRDILVEQNCSIFVIR